MTGDEPLRILVCVGGSIAAYKACDLVSTLVQGGYTVDVAMTPAAEHFVRPLTFAALTHRPVFTQSSWFQAPGDDRSPADHLHATASAALIAVAPCTANLIGKFAHGIADEIVSSTWLGAACPRLVAPSMNTRMWANPVVQANVALLRKQGVRILGPDTGYLAEAEEGPGRMREPDDIAAEIHRLLAAPQA